MTSTRHSPSQAVQVKVTAKVPRLGLLSSLMLLFCASRCRMKPSIPWTLALLAARGGDRFVSSFQREAPRGRRLDCYKVQPRYKWNLADQSTSSSSNPGDGVVPIDAGVSREYTTTTTTPSTKRAAAKKGSSAVLSQKPLATSASHLQMLSFYHFQPITDPWHSRNELFASIQSIEGLRGTIYLAEEGVNAQLAVPPGPPLEQLLHACSTVLPFDPFENCPPNLGDLVPMDTPTFNRLIVRVRDFILRDGIPRKREDDSTTDNHDDPTTTGITTSSSASLEWNDAGQELSPAEWHQQLLSLQSDQEEQSTTAPILLDCRNLYESQEGTFRGAIPLETQTFQESWPILDSLTKDLPRDQPLHIFCTGGIRCVKVGAYLKQELGFENVNRLQHGIIGYEKWIQSQQQQEEQKGNGSDDDSTTVTTTDTTSLWEGTNFLFDKRRIATADRSISEEDSC